MQADGSRAATASLIAAVILVAPRVGAATGAATLTVPPVGEATAVVVASVGLVDSVADSAAVEGLGDSAASVGVDAAFKPTRVSIDLHTRTRRRSCL